MKKQAASKTRTNETSIYPLAFTILGRRIINKRSAKIHIGNDFDLIRKEQPKTKVITKSSVESAIQEIETILEALHANFSHHHSDDIFQIIELDKRIRNFADRDKRECENLYREVNEQLQNAA